MPTLTNDYVQELLTLGPFLGVDATTAPYYVDPNHAVDAVNVVPDRAYQGYVTVQGRISLAVTGLPAEPLAMVKALDGTGVYYLAVVAGNIYFFRPSSAAAILPKPAGGVLTVGPTFAVAGQWIFICTDGQNDTPLKIKYDTHTVTNWGIAPPASAPTVADGGAGVLNFAGYQYRVTFGVTSGGISIQESSPGPSSTVISLVNRQAALSNIPVSSDPQVNQRNVYRLDSAGQYRLVGVISDNTTTTATDNVADGSVTGQVLIARRDPPKNFYSIFYHKDCLFGFGWASADPRTQSDLVFSNPTEPWGFDYASKLLPVGENSGTDIAVGGTSNSGIALLFKTRTVFGCFGETPNDFYVQKLFDIGCVSAASIVTAQGVTYWLSAEGAYSFDGGAPKYISARIKAFLETNRAQLSSAVGFYRDRCYFLSFETLGVTWMFDTTQDEWWKIGWATGVATFDPNDTGNSAGAVVAGTAAGAIVQWFGAETDLGAAITSSYTSRIADSSMPEATKQYRKVVILAPPQSGAIATITVTADPGLTAKSVARNVDLGSGQQAKIVSLPANIKGREVQVVVSVTASQQVQLQRVSLYGWVERRLAPQG